jgi:hypothetical protein
MDSYSWGLDAQFKVIESVRCRPNRIGLLDKTPASSAFLPSRASSRTRFPTLLTPPTPVRSNISVVVHNLYCV